MVRAPWRRLASAYEDHMHHEGLSLETAKRLDRAVSEAQQHVMSGHKRSKKKDMSAASDLVSKAAAFAGRFSWPRALC